MNPVQDHDTSAKNCSPEKGRTHHPRLGKNGGGFYGVRGIDTFLYQACPALTAGTSVTLLVIKYLQEEGDLFSISFCFDLFFYDFYRSDRSHAAE